MLSVLSFLEFKVIAKGLQREYLEQGQIQNGERDAKLFSCF
jgi:hypothetical protein